MISDKRHIQQLAALLLKKGITDIVISPGSRNAPLINTFTGVEGFSCRNIVDERSAGYFALGLALAKQKPVVLVCSSGTATLNYTPAVAEAFYQNIPLVVLTADRPNYWIDQAESQCIRQENIYQNFTKKGISLPLGESEKELWYAARQINECLNLALSGKKGPVHINIPFEEPLHQLVKMELPEVKEIELITTQSILSEDTQEELRQSVGHSNKTLVLAGQLNPDAKLNSILSAFVEKTGAVVLQEHLSNLSDTQFCASIDLLMASIHEENMEAYRPDLLITCGGQFVSKALKQFLRKHQPTEHWHLSAEKEHFDTYQSLKKVITTNGADFFKAITPTISHQNKEYLQLWKNKEAKVNERRDTYLETTIFSDLKAFGQITKHIPGATVIHLGNSSPVRYALIHERVKQAIYLGNRGTAGIDGCLSTAVGYANKSDRLNTVLLGDLTFFYDSNALWNRYVGKNLRIIVIHNGGGNIFGMIKGPSDSPAYNEHFLAENTHKAEGLARAFGLEYFKAEDEASLEKALKGFYSLEQQKAALLEVFTAAEVNVRVFRELFREVKG
jgi:2-succinyl-5-enolpyruvyl-6-hydroxy-3-cyclohexene-1-carboxylate synthase